MITSAADRLRRHLDGRWADVREQARLLAADPALTPTSALDSAAQRADVLRRLRLVADSGMCRSLFPLEVGGDGDLGGAITSFEMLGMGDLSLMVKVGVQWGLFGGAILHLGTAEHHKAYLEDVMSLDLLGCFAMSETGHGSDVQHLLTTATYDPATETFDLHTPVEAATKDWIGNAAEHGRMAVVFAQLVTDGEGRGVHAFLVPIRDAAGVPAPGVTITDVGRKMGLNGVDNGRIAFDHVVVPRRNLLDRYGSVAADGTYSTPIEDPNRRFFTMLGTLVQGRVSVAGGAAGATKVALAVALRYAAVRRQFSAPGSDREVVLLDYLTHQRRLLVPLARTYALHFAQSELVAALHDVFGHLDAPAEDRRSLERRAAGIKALTTWHATATIQACREACGGQGYLEVNQLPKLKADSDVFTTFEGDNTVLLQLVGKELLAGMASEFGDLSPLARAGFVMEQAADVVLERTGALTWLSRLRAAAPGQDDTRDLYDRDWQVGLLAWRESHMRDGVAKRLRGAASSADPFAAFNSAQDHLVATARAHVEREALEAFARGVDSAPDEQTRAVLGRVCDLFALSTIEADRGWFLEHGRLSPATSKAVTAQVNRLLGELRPDALLLVDGFGVPSSAVTSPVATGAEQARQAEALAADSVV
jgi:acyl-CoA oxidase